eukprot:8505415-Karenia_brevis.AAC.1
MMWSTMQNFMVQNQLQIQQLQEQQNRRDAMMMATLSNILGKKGVEFGPKEEFDQDAGASASGQRQV